MGDSCRPGRRTGRPRESGPRKQWTLVCQQKKGPVLEHSVSNADLGAPDHLAAGNHDLPLAGLQETGTRVGRQGATPCDPGVGTQSAQAPHQRLIDPPVGAAGTPEGPGREHHRVGKFTVVQHRATPGRSTDDCDVGPFSEEFAVAHSEWLVATERKGGRGPTVEA